MILTNDRASYISVFKIEFKPTLSVERIGEMRRLPDHEGVVLWRMEFIGRNRSVISDRLNDSEKRQVIRTLDKLNGFGPRMESDMRYQWDKIIGRRSWADIVADGLTSSDMAWADIVQEVENQ